MNAPFDFLSQCRPGMVLKTRDRRDARIVAVDPAAGTISGEVQMLGPCLWNADGRFKDAPGGAAGPWDLMPPTAAGAAPAKSGQSIAEALQRGDPNPGCCD